MKSVLLSGANGFVGRTLSERLKAEDFHVRALLRHKARGPWDEVVCFELGREALPLAVMRDIDFVFHLAGVAHATGVDEKIYQRVNVAGTKDLVETAAASGVSGFVFFSSVKAVKDPPDGRCIDESWAEWPEDAYGKSKREAEDIVLETAVRVGMHAVILRPTLVYGPGVKGNLRKVIRLVASGRCPPLPDTVNRRSMVHVEDLCGLAIDAAGNPSAAGKRYIVADKRPYSTYELYAGILQALGRSVPHWSVPPQLLRAVGQFGDVGERLLGRRMPVNSGMISRLLNSACYSSALCQEELHWLPRHDLAGSIPEMVSAWKKESEDSGQAQGVTRS